MNAASKFTKGDGEEEQLGGTVFTKNLKLGMKMPKKIVEGRNNWLLMEKDLAYEEEDIGQNCESNFEHCNEMANVLMPRDFLAGLTKYFIKDDGQHLTYFQEAQLEACEVFAHRRPLWRKRKSKSSALWLSMFSLVEKEVEECEDELCKEMYVEIFNSRDDYIEMLMKAMNRIDEVEASMVDGDPMSMPSWVLDGDQDQENDPDNGVRSKTTSNNVDMNQLVRDSLNVIADLSDVDKTKYVKIFQSKPTSIAIQHRKIQSLAKEKGMTVPNFLTQQTYYPFYVKLKTVTFTKLKASSSRSSTNTGPGFCTSIILKYLDHDTIKKAAASFKIDLQLLESETQDEDDDLDIDPSDSQAYPQFTQSTTETIKVCEVCNYHTRSKVEMNSHIAAHPKCQVCRQMCESEADLKQHAETHLTDDCIKCGTSPVEDLADVAPADVATADVAPCDVAPADVASKVGKSLLKM